MSLKDNSSRLTRWRLRLSEFDFSVDALSRIELNNEETNSLIANPTENPSSLIDSSKTATVHTDAENPILEVPITDFPLNKYH